MIIEETLQNSTDDSDGVNMRLARVPPGYNDCLPLLETHTADLRLMTCILYDRKSNRRLALVV